MGAHPYWYVVPYDEPKRALDKLREREFRAGRYSPVIRYLRFPITNSSPSPGPSHPTIDAAFDAGDAEGTRSILDIIGIASKSTFLKASPVPDAALLAQFGTIKPTRKDFKANWDKLRGAMGKPDFRSDVEKGHAIYFLLYENDSPSEIVFFGYSVD